MNPFATAQTSNAMLVWISPEGRFLDANEQVCRALGYDREALLAMAVWDVDPNFPPDRWPDYWRKLRQAKTLHFQTTQRHRDGSQTPIEVFAHYLELDGRAYSCALAYPLTPQRQAEIALRESEERLALTLAVSGQGLYDLDIATGQAVFSDEYARMLGYEPSELVLTPAVWATWLHPEERERILRLFEDCVTGKQSDYRAEFRLRARSGEWIWVLSAGKVVRWDAAGRPLRMVGTHLDITERKRTEEALRESEERFAKAFHASPAPMCLTDIETGRFLDVNKRLLRMLDYTREQMIGRTSVELGAWADPGARERMIAQLRADRCFPETPIRFRTRTGEIRQTLYSAEILRLGEQDILLSLVYDITEKRRAEEALRESEERFRSIFNHAPLGIALVDGANDRITLSNAAFQRLMGYSAEQLQSMTVVEITHPDDIGKDLEQYHALLEGRISNYHLEKRYLRRDGATIWVDLTVSAIRDETGKPLYAMGMVEDITEHKRAEAALRASEERFAKAFHASPAPMAISIIETGHFLDVNEQWLKMLGYTGEETIGRTSMELGIWADPGTRERMTARLRADGFFREASVRFRTKTGAILDALWSAEIIRLGEQEVMLSLIYDITDRKQAEEALRLTQFSVDRASDSIIWVDDEGKLIYVNDAACASVGYTREELLRMKVFDIDPDFPPEGFEEHKIELQRRGSMKFESRHRAKNGRVFPVEVTTNYLEYKGRFLGCAFDRDITERKRAEAELERHREHLEELVAERTAELRQAMIQLVQSEKLAALGSLVAGIAHELNTPLGNARTVAGALGEEVRAFAAAVESGALRRSQVDAFLNRSREAVDLMERNATRAADLIGHFKQVAVDQTSMRRRRFLLRRTVEELLATLQPQFKRSAHRVELDIPPDLELDSYPGPLEQVLANLVDNSLTHGFAGVETGVIRIHAASPNAVQVHIDYMDNGVGIPEKILKRIFEPFFTTQLGSGGSGLGLYIVYNLVTGVLGGTIQSHSVVGQGIRFTLVLPRIGPDQPVVELPV